MNDRISVRQVKILLILDLFSTAALVLPRTAVEYARQDGWMLVIGATLLTLVYAYVITKLARMFPGQTFVDFSSKIASRPVGLFLSVAFIGKLLIGAAFELRVFGELVKQILLQRTPIEIVMISMLLVVGYLVRKGYECRARIAEILIVIVLVPIVFIFTIALMETDFRNLAPVFNTSIQDLAIGSYYLAFSFSGVELMLLATAFLTNPQKSTQATFTSVIVVGVLNLVTVVITIASFGVMETTNQIWPVMSVMQIIDLPGAFIERQEALMIIFWIITVFSILNAHVYFISLIVTKSIRSKEQKYLVLPFLPIIYFLSLLPDNIVQTYEWMDKIRTYFGILFLLPVPLSLLIIAKVRKLGESNGS